MKKVLVFLAVFLSSPTFASSAFKYQTNCYLETNQQYLQDVCTVIETREKGGALRSRNIFSNRFGLTIKSWFDKEKGFMTWDSHNKFNYKWEYKIGQVENKTGYSYVMPGFLLESVSWD